MTTLGTHPFIPAASRLGAPILCQQCPNEASHPVHDWLTASASWYPTLLPMTPEEMVMLPNLFTADEWAERDAQHPDSSQPIVEEVR